MAESEAKRRPTNLKFGAGMEVAVPTANYLLAMKLRACRPPLPGYAGDYGDIEFLLKKMKVGAVEEAVAIHDKFFPNDELSDTARLVVAAFLAGGVD